MKLAIIKYNAGNIQSVTFALQRLGIDPVLTDDPYEIHAADKVIFPGVGEASTAMRYLKEANLDQLIPELKQPVLGICLGMQVMCMWSEENDTDCMGIFDHKVVRFRPNDTQIKVPHMGWNELVKKEGTIFQELPEPSHVYFVHSYFVEEGPFTAASCEYVQSFSAGLQKDNFYATQFHPEKSGKVGAKILENFLTRT